MSANVKRAAGAKRDAGQIALFAAAIFVGAFLLFQVQPLIARAILPWFGGSASVWSTSMMFFQVSLLAGYAYAHIIATRLPIRRQIIVHVAVAALAMLALPIIPREALQPGGSDNPTLAVIIVLAATVGAPYIVLSATGPLLQAWIGRVDPDRSPYRFYAVSNAASLVGLISYPLVIERSLSIRAQAWVWSAGYVGLVALTFWIGRRLLSPAAEPAGATDAKKRRPFAEATSDEPVTIGTRLLWLALPGTAVVVFLAVTNQMTLEVAQIPLFWVVPLSLYLLSFIITFAKPELYHRGVFGVLLAIALTLVVRTFVYDTGSLTTQALIYSAGVFVMTMSLHGELVRLIPPARRLTDFYLTIAAGGALGGAGVALIAPRIFSGLWELHLGLVATAVLVGVAWRREVGSSSRADDSETVESVWRRRLHRGVTFVGWVGLVFGPVVMGFLLVRQIVDQARDTFAIERSFYGVLRVGYDYPPYPELHTLSLMHGPIEHGFQYIFEERADWPTTYYSPKSGVGITIEEMKHERAEAGDDRPLSIGVVGLGTGTLAAYAEEGDSIVFYEIDEVVVSLAERWFTYMDRARERGADVEVVLGDARLSMQRQLRQGHPPQFDVLALDAFSGDAVPVHLLTREAYEIYRRVLAPGGVIVFHTSNIHLDLTPVVRGLAALDRIQAVLIEAPGDDGIGAYGSDWILVTDNTDLLASDAVVRKMTEWAATDRNPVLWTDDHSDLLGILN